LAAPFLNNNNNPTTFRETWPAVGPIDRTRWYVRSGEMRFKAFATDEVFQWSRQDGPLSDYTASPSITNQSSCIRGANRLEDQQAEVAPLGWKRWPVPPTDA